VVLRKLLGHGLETLPVFRSPTFACSRNWQSIQNTFEPAQNWDKERIYILINRMGDIGLSPGVLRY
jgi:hypothetical protein